MPLTPLRTPLYDRHLAAGAKMVDFAGWEMPVQYPTGLRFEHIAVREGCGIFDVSHMGQIETVGARALELLQRLLSNDVSAISWQAGQETDGQARETGEGSVAGEDGVASVAGEGGEAVEAGEGGEAVEDGERRGEGEGGAQYSLLCREDGGVLDDLFTYRLGEERYLTVTNAANHLRDLDRFTVHAPVNGVKVIDRAADYAMLAVQGPAARGIVAELAEEPLPQRLRAKEMALAGVSALVCGTGYTGEDGVEVLCAPQHAGLLWDEMVGRGAQPAGLGARDTLRLEACFHLYGNDLSVERNPIEAGLGWCCKESTGFIGAEAVSAMRRQGPRWKLVAFAIEGQGIARAGNEVVGGGVVTSGTLSPCLGVGVGLAYLPAVRCEPGSRFEVDVRGKIRSAIVMCKPLYRKGDADG